MDLKTRIARWTTPLVLASFMTANVVVPVAHAGMVGTGKVVQQTQPQIDREDLKQYLARDDVREQLEAWGVDAAEAQDRVDRLSDQEVAELNARMQELPAGGSDIIGAIVFVFLVLLITDILGFTDVFPFVKKTVRR